MAESTTVVTDELHAAAATLQQLAAEAASMATHLATIDGITSLSWLQGAAAPRSAAQAELDIGQARIVMIEIEIGARGLSWSLVVAAKGYGFVEGFIQGIIGDLTGGAWGTVASRGVSGSSVGR